MLFKQMLNDVFCGAHGSGDGALEEGCSFSKQQTHQSPSETTQAWVVKSSAPAGQSNGRGPALTGTRFLH